MACWYCAKFSYFSCSVFKFWLIASNVVNCIKSLVPPFLIAPGIFTSPLDKQNLFAEKLVYTSMLHKLRWYGFFGCMLWMEGGVLQEVNTDTQASILWSTFFTLIFINESQYSFPKWLFSQTTWLLTEHGEGLLVLHLGKVLVISKCVLFDASKSRFLSYFATPVIPRVQSQKWDHNTSPMLSLFVYQALIFFWIVTRMPMYLSSCFPSVLKFVCRKAWCQYGCYGVVI